MLHSRISLLKSYLNHLPPSYLNNHTELNPSDPSNPNEITTSYPILRSISALVSRIALLNPASSDIFDIESKAEKNDVNLIQLLGTVGRGLGDAREVGRKFHIVENSRGRKGGMGGGSLDALRGSVDDMFAGDMKPQPMGMRGSHMQT
jgi:COP9 signalosome complex subunit 6